MITTLNVKCPHCEQVSEIFLSTAVSVIILNCPSCSSPVMYFKRKIFLLDNKQVREITGKPRTAAVFKLLEEMNDVKALCPAIRSPRACENAVAEPARNRRVLDQTEEKYITADDCTNLRIELELYPDSRDFINRL